MINNKKSKILIGCLALLLVLSVGYAYFSQNITINGTATAKGDFSITAACTMGIDSKLGTVSSLGLDPENGYKNDSCTVSGNTVSLNVDFEYPGAKRYFTVKMTNSGTIDASLNVGKDLKITGKFCMDGLHDIYDVNGQIEEASECIDENHDFANYANGFELGYMFIEKTDGTIIADGDEQIREFYDEEGNIVIKPNMSLYLGVSGKVPQLVEANTDRMNSMFVTNDIHYSFNWHQVTK